MDKNKAAALLDTHSNKLIADKSIKAQLDSIDLGFDAIHIKQKLFHIAHELTAIPTCQHPECSNAVKWSIRHQNYPNCCSRRCANRMQSSARIDKRKKTNQLRYGGNAPASSVDIREKIKKTNIKRYGTEYKQVIADKSKKAIVDKYGVENISMLDECKRKKVESSKRKFGTQHPMQTTAVQLRTKQTLLERYNVENINQIHIAVKSIELLNDKDFLIRQHHTLRQPLEQIAKLLGVSHKCISSSFDRFDIPKRIYNNKISVGEQQVFDFVKSICPDAVQSNRTILSGKELDIYIPSQKIAIEYCGLYWHSTAHDRITRNYHRDKLTQCNNQGIRLITLFEDEWLSTRKLVENKLTYILQGSTKPRVYARNTQIVTLSDDILRNFLTTNHIQGCPRIYSEAYGLSISNAVVAVVVFTKRKSCYELVRYATNTSVVGGFSKLLKHAATVIDTPQFISFADLRWSEGDLYKHTNWKLDKITPPDYKYVEGDTLAHKFNYRHSCLHRKLTNYDPSLSEYQNTKNHNIHRIYNCGLLRFTYRLNKNSK